LDFFVFYVILCALICVDRNTLRTKIIKAPEIIACIGEVEHLETLLNSFYNCNYDTYFNALVNILPSIQNDRFLSRHTQFFIRELRLVGYSQFLQSYRSVTMKSMADSFGISIDLLDQDLSRFIYAGRLFCKIDKVSGIVECTRPDAKHAQYAAVIKEGDILLNRLQKLARVISY